MFITLLFVLYGYTIHFQHLYYISLMKKSKYFFEKSSNYTNNGQPILWFTQKQEFFKTISRFFVSKKREIYNFFILLLSQFTELLGDIILDDGINDAPAP